MEEPQGGNTDSPTEAAGDPGSTTQLRVKVYVLNDRGEWDDKGTGHVCVEYLEETESPGLIVTAESETLPILIHSILKKVTYQRSGDDTIITWSDPVLSTDIAMSFQEVRGCNYIWEQVLHVQESFRDDSPPRGAQGPDSPHAGHRFGGGSMEDDFDIMAARDTMGPFDAHHRSHDMLGSLGGDPPGSSGAVDLPEPELSQLKGIARAVTEVSMFQRDRLGQQLAARPEYIGRLLELFKMCEDLEDEESLALLFVIFKQIVLLNETGLFDLLFDDAYVMDFVGALEYEPDVAPEQRPRHREFLRDQAVFKEVVPICDPAVRAKIHQTYRIGYLKDVVLPRLLDDATFATLSSLQLFNNIEILMSLHQDRAFLPDLFRRLQSAKPGSQEWADLVAFLQELCLLTKHLQAAQRNSLLLRLVGLGLFQVITTAMSVGASAVRQRATDILLADVQHDPSHLRSYLLSSEGGPLFTQLIKVMLNSPDPDPEPEGVQEQVLEMLKMLLDPDTLDGSAEKDKFVELFYDNHISQLLATVVDAAAAADAHADAAGAGAGAGPSANTVGLVVDLLCFCVVSHSYRIKYYVLRNNVVEKVLKLLGRKERWLAVAAVRFLRTALLMKDEFYNRYLVKNRLLQPVVAAFLENGPRYNLLNSACLELFDFIRKENLKGLVSELMEHHWEAQLERVDYCDVLRAMHLRYEQNQDRAAGSKAADGQQQGGGGEAAQAEARQAREAQLVAQQRAVAAAEQRRRRGEREVDEDEENYFDREDDADDDDDDDGGSGAGGASAAAAAAPGGSGRSEAAPAAVHHPPLGADAAGGGVSSRAVAGRVVLASTSPLPGGMGSLVDYGDDDDDCDDDTLPLSTSGGGGGAGGGRGGDDDDGADALIRGRKPGSMQKRLGERPGSPPLEKRFRSAGTVGGGAGGTSGGDAAAAAAAAAGTAAKPWPAPRQGAGGSSSSPPLR